MPAKMSKYLSAPLVKVLLSLVSGRTYANAIAIENEESRAGIILKLAELERLGFVTRVIKKKEKKVNYTVTWQTITRLWGEYSHQNLTDAKHTKFIRRYFELYAESKIYKHHRVGDLVDVFDFFNTYVFLTPTRRDDTYDLDRDFSDLTESLYSLTDERSKKSIGDNIFALLKKEFPRKRATQP